MRQTLREGPAIDTFDPEFSPPAKAADPFPEFHPYLPPEFPPEPGSEPAPDGPRPHWSILDLLLMIGGFLLLGGLGVLLLRVGVSHANGGKMPDTPNLDVSLGALLIQVVASGVAVYLVGRARRGYSWADMGFRPAAWYWWLSAAGAGLACIPILGIVALVVSKLLGEADLKNPQVAFLAPGGKFSWRGAVGMFLMAGLLVPWAEELFFRGVLFRWMRQHLNLYAAAGITAVIFGAFHFHPVIGAAVVPLGFMAALAYEWSGSLWPAVTIHAVNNGAKILLLYAMLAAGVTPEKLQEMAKQAQKGGAPPRVVIEPAEPTEAPAPAGTATPGPAGTAPATEGEQ